MKQVRGLARALAWGCSQGVSDEGGDIAIARAAGTCMASPDADTAGSASVGVAVPPEADETLADDCTLVGFYTDTNPIESTSSEL